MGKTNEIFDVEAMKVACYALFIVVFFTWVIVVVLETQGHVETRPESPRELDEREMGVIIDIIHRGLDENALGAGGEIHPGSKSSGSSEHRISVAHF